MFLILVKIYVYIKNVDLLCIQYSIYILKFRGLMLF